MRLGTFAALAAASALFWLSSAVADPPRVDEDDFANPRLGADSNRPVPRFVSLKTEGARGRRGPGFDHITLWEYRRVGLPLMVTGESGPWRRVRDPDGDVVWMHEQNLAERRTIYVRESTALRRTPDRAGRVLAYLEPGVTGPVTACDNEWRRVNIEGRDGWVDNDDLWGGVCAGLATADDDEDNRGDDYRDDYRDYRDEYRDYRDDYRDNYRGDDRDDYRDDYGSRARDRR
jgi:SH3-like domain-containing protein